MIEIIEIEDDGLDETLMALEAFCDVAQEELTKAMYRATASIENRAQTNAPVDRGRLRGSLGSRVETLGPTMIRGVIGSSLKDEVYPDVMEHGRPAGAWSKAPPFRIIKEWVRRVIRPESEKELAAITGGVVRKIMREGIKERRYMAGALEQARASIQSDFENAVAAIVRRLTE